LELRREHQESEIGRVLLFVAVTIRNAIDQNPSRADYWLSHSPTDVVGVLTPDLKEAKKFEKLHFREACNKIIHSESINFDYGVRKPRRGDVLNPRVYIYGEHRRRHWKATIEIDRFTDIACLLNV
jgi:folate-dependent tRNA-U54 methylase TrmFO/GidA